MVILPSFAIIPTEEMSTRVLKGFHKAANRSFAILELLWFGPISMLGREPINLPGGRLAMSAVPR
jgi:hypothetical protein